MVVTALRDIGANWAPIAVTDRLYVERLYVFVMTRLGARPETVVPESELAP